MFSENNSDDSDRANKIREIINLKFDEELKLMEKDAVMVEEQIAKTKDLLKQLRYAVVSEFYKSTPSDHHEQIQRNIQSNAIVPSSLSELDQQAIHPAVKKLIGKRPRTDDQAQSSRQTDATAVQLTSSRGRNQLKHSIVVGNTSQFIQPQSDDSEEMFKWMCYVKSKSPVPIERLVKKIRFHLDSSFKPNDVVDVSSSPFQLVRRGHSVFCIKLIIFFHDDVDLKPVQIFHQIELDKRRSGHQVLGNETTTEVFTNNFLDSK